jgi:hypothetical protein
MVAGDGEVYIVYPDYTAYSGRASVAKSDAGSWVFIGSRGFSDTAVYYPSIAVENGVPYVAYRDTANSNGLTVMGFVGGTWTAIGNKNITGYQTGSATALCVYNSAPLIISNFYGGDKLEYAYWWNGSSWESFGNFMKYSNSYSLVVHNGQPYVAFAESWSDRGIDSMAVVLRYGPRH